MEPTENLVDSSIHLGDVSDIFGELANIAINSNRSVAQVVRVALRNYIANHGVTPDVSDVS